MLRTLLLTALLATPASAEPVRLKILTFNIWYGGDQVSFDRVIEAIKRKRFLDGTFPVFG